MLQLNNLPSDVLLEILLCSGNLAELSSISLTCKALYEVFQNRRALVLQHVFTKQIRDTHQNVLSQLRSTPNCKAREECVKYVARTMKGCFKRPDDALNIGIAAWNCFLSFKSPLWVHVDFGEMLIDRCANQDQQKLALSVASELWQCMLKGGTFEARTTLGTSAQREASRFAQKLAVMYADAGHHEQALQTFRECYQSHSTQHGPDIFAALLKVCRNSEAFQQDRDLVSFSYARIEESRTRFLRHGARTPKRYDFYWTHCLITILFELGRYTEAIVVLEDTLGFSEQHNLNPMFLVGLSRKLIKLRKDKQEHDDALKIRGLVFESMSRSIGQRTTISAYVAWAKDFAFDLRLLGRREEALDVEEQAWIRLSSRAATSRDRSLVFHCRNLSWALTKAYLELGRTQKANEIQKTYEELASYHNEVQMR